MTSCFKKDQTKIRSFNWYRYVINGRKRYKRRNMSLLSCNSNLISKANNKYMKGYDKNKESSYLQY